MTTTMQDAMTRAMRRAGFEPHEMKIFGPLMEYFRAGGTRGRLLIVCDEVEHRLSGKGLRTGADGHGSGADARQPDDGGEANVSVPDGLRGGAKPPSPQVRQEGQSPRAKSQSVVANLAREPSAGQRAAALHVAKSIAVTVLDTYRVRDGRSIGDIRFGELEHLRCANAMEASLIRQIQRHATADHDARVRDVIKPDQLNQMMQRAAEVADAA